MARKNTKKKMQQEQAIEPDLFGDEFFSQPPAAHTTPAIDLSWEEPEDAPVIAPDKRRAMHATIAIFSVFAVAVGGFVIYTQLIMPTPVTLGASSSALALPQAIAYEAPAPVVTAPVAPAPIAEPTPVVEAPPAAEAATAVVPAAIAAPSIETRAPRAVIATPAPTADVVRTRRAVPSAPTEPSSLGAQAMRMLNSGQPSDARRLAQQATQANPERADGWIVLGAAHDALGDHEAAKTAYANCTARAMGPRVATCKALAR